MSSYEARFYYAFPGEKLTCVGRESGQTEYTTLEIVSGEADPLAEFLHNKLGSTRLGTTNFCMMDEDNVKTAIMFNYDNRLNKLIVNVWAGLHKPTIRILKQYPEGTGYRFNLSQGCQFLCDTVSFFMLLIDNYPRDNYNSDKSLHFQIDKDENGPYAIGSFSDENQLSYSEYLTVSVDIIFYDYHVTFHISKQKWLNREFIDSNDILYL